MILFFGNGDWIKYYIEKFKHKGGEICLKNII